jgi:NADPH2:quinone reductase
MRAARCAAYGAPDVVSVEEVAEPELRPGELLVDVAAAAVNFPDALIVADRYQVSAALPFTPGSEFSGNVVRTGPDVADFEPGDRVMGATFVGAFAEKVAVPSTSLQHVPPAADLTLAAAVGVGHFTAYHALHTVGRVRPGQWVVVLGAAGGVGLAAVQLAARFGARVAAVASTTEKLDRCRDAGASSVVSSAADSLKERLRSATDGGADVVIDVVGGPAAEQAIRASRRGGRFVCVGFASGEIPRIPLNLVLLKGVSIHGFEARSFIEHEPAATQRSRLEILRLLASGDIGPHIHAVYPLAEVPQAMQQLLDRQAIGKVLVDPRA